VSNLIEWLKKSVTSVSCMYQDDDANWSLIKLALICRMVLICLAA